jgi:hypothetical protein
MSRTDASASLGVQTPRHQIRAASFVPTDLSIPIAAPLPLPTTSPNALRFALP